MKVLLLNANDSSGGAAKATRRLCTGLREAGVDARMLVQIKKSEEPFIHGSSSRTASYYFQWHPHFDAFPVCFYPRRTRYIFSPAFLPQRIVSKVRSLSPDIVHLNWVCEGFVRIEALPLLTAPLVWTLHDSWPFTGGCHLPFDCHRYEAECGCCPCLGSDKENDLSRWVWKRKKKLFPSLDLTLVAPSRSMAKRALASSLFNGRRVEVIPNGIDTCLYKPVEKDEARNALGLPLNKKLILFSALGGYGDGNKGFKFLHAALDTLRGQGTDIELLVVGTDQPPDDLQGLPVHLLGRVEQEGKMPLVYSAADVTAVPSLEESLSFTVMESMACGTPCVASDVGGIPDLIDHAENGFLCPPQDSAELSRGIRWLLADQARLTALGVKGRFKIERQFSMETITKQYLKLYAELLKKPFSAGSKP